MTHPDPAESRRPETRLTMRIKPAHKALFERAAAARGLSLTDYITSIALAESLHVIAEQTVFALDDESYNRLQEFLDRPAEANPKLEELFQRNRSKKWKVISTP